MAESKAQITARKQMLAALAKMPEESFGWFVLWASGVPMQYPDGLGGFQEASRKAITALRTAAKAYKEAMGA